METILPRMRVVTIKSWRLAAVIGCLLLVLSACSSQKNASEAQTTDPSYLKWRQDVVSELGTHPYVLPGYDAGTGPLELIYDPDAEDFEFELYRSKDYLISKELNGVHTVHDHYYSYSMMDGELDESELLSSYGVTAQSKRKQVNEKLSILNEHISKYKDGNIIVYEISEDTENVDPSKAIVKYLKSKNVDSAKVLLVHMEGRINLRFNLPVRNQTAVIQFTLEKFDAIDPFLGQLP